MDLSAPRLRRLLSRLRTRAVDYAGLAKAASADEARGWAAAHTFQMFNGNVLRAKIAQALVERAGCDLFVETGTSFAATCIGARRFLDLPVWTCENSRPDYLIARAVTLGMRGVHLANLDSTRFLERAMLRISSEGRRPFFYLDAHEGKVAWDSLPLREELRLLMQLGTFVVLIDDFRVPGADAFRWGRYGASGAIDLPLVRKQLLAGGIRQVYFPAYAADQETGYKSGYCVFWRAPALDAALRTPNFPLDLLRSVSLT